MLQSELQRHYKTHVACRELDVKFPLLLGTKAVGLISCVIQALADQGYTESFWYSKQRIHHLFYFFPFPPSSLHSHMQIPQQWGSHAIPQRAKEFPLINLSCAWSPTAANSTCPFIIFHTSNDPARLSEAEYIKKFCNLGGATSWKK